MLPRLYRDGGQTLTLGNPPIALPLGRGLGGTTLINSGTCFRTPPAVLERWEREYGLEGLDADSMRAVLRARRAGAVRRRGHARACRRERGGGTARRGAARLVARVSAAQRNRLRRLRRVRVRMPAARQAAHRHHLRPARALPVRRVADRRAVGAASSGVAPRGGSTRAPPTARSTSTRRSSSSRPARSIPRRCSPAAAWAWSGTARAQPLAASRHRRVARMDHIVDMARGVPQSFYVDEFAAEGIMLEGSPDRPRMSRCRCR